MSLTTRIAVISIIVEKDGAREKVNHLLQEYSSYIIGRLGIPYRKRELSVIVVVIDAPADAISALTGKLGLLNGVNARTIFSKKEFPVDEDA
ncbi:MAG: iron-only hydrogenase system regulator [Thermoguttaceae bacterium]|nr:iron-only hydrogenase system regulator [Thermoguttaceae bacterium]